MSKEDLFLVLEALKGAHTEIEALIDDDIHVPSGDLMEQIEDAIDIVEEYHSAAE